MKKIRILSKLKQAGIIAVIRAINSEEAIKISKACIKGGINCIEITYTVPGATDVIKKLKEIFEDNELVIGAGSVLDSFTARIAILAGAEYIVSPGHDVETAKLCNKYNAPYIPGCMTITEMITALENGADIIKLFPGNHFEPSIVKAIKGPFPYINIIPTGGVSLDNVEEWVKNGVIAVGVGGQLISGAKIGDYEDITNKAILFVEKINNAREEM